MPKHKKIPDDVREEIKAASRSGKSVKEICLEFKISGATATRILGRVGIGRGRPRIRPVVPKGRQGVPRNGIRKNNFAEFNERRRLERMRNANKANSGGGSGTGT
jgi:hypothetical protein